MDRAWLLEHFTLFRLALFICCCAWWALGYCWFRPRGRELPAAIMAAWAQFSLGLLLDIAIVRAGLWSYRPMGFSIAGVPVDLHADWTLIWGFFLVWDYSRLYRYWPVPRFVLPYLAAWVLFTLAFDAAIYEHMLFVERASPWWWAVDAGFLFTVLGSTLWVYHTILFPPRSDAWRGLACLVRSTLYVASIAYVVYIYLPGVVLDLTGGAGVRPLVDDWRILAALCAVPAALGLWANAAFALRGHGTPLPLDPPRRLVTDGPYAYVRNPMQLSGIGLSLVLLLYWPTWYMAAYVIDVAVASSVLIYLYERRQLYGGFGAAYHDYRSQVREWVPRLRPYRPSAPTAAPALEAAA